MNKQLLSIVIPAYNEELRLPNTFDRIEEYIKNKTYNTEIIVVVEKSTDNTLQVVKNYESRFKNIRHIENPGKMGKGYSVRQGVLDSKGDIILFTDADLSTPIEELHKMMLFFDRGYDCCIGDRVQIKMQPWYRICMGLCFRWINNVITGLPFKDTQCGFKLFNRKFADAVFKNMQIDGFAFDIEMLMLAQKLSFKTKAVKVKWFNDERSTVDPIRDSLKMFRDLIKIKKNIKAIYIKKESQLAVN